MSSLSPTVIDWVWAVAGFAVGCLSCLGLACLAQQRRLDAGRIARELDRREETYGRFIEQASEMWLDTFESPHDPANLIAISALVGRVRMASSRPVVEAAEAVVEFLLDIGKRRPADVRRLIAEAPQEFMAPLEAFSAACRSEREKMLRGV
jgi:hypothetical protein